MRGASNPYMDELLALEYVLPDTTVSEHHTQTYDTRPSTTGAPICIDGSSALPFPRLKGAENEQQPPHRSLIRFTIAARTVMDGLPRWEAPSSLFYRYALRRER